MEFTSIPNEETLSEKNRRICPITNNIFQDPVLAGDGHVYERAAIVTWIQTNGTSPITLEPLHIGDLVPEENINRLCQHQQTSVAYATENEEVTLPPLQASHILPVIQQSPMMIIPQRSIQDNNRIKYIWCIIITLIIFAVILSIIVFVGSRSSDSSTYITASYGPSVSYSTTYILPNNCTLTNITTLFSLNNTAQFEGYKFYSVPYTAVANQTMITFAFRQDPAYWVIDDISIKDGISGIEVVQNGDFENETFASFSYCNQQGINGAVSAPGNQSHTGSHGFVDFTPFTPDYISQMLILTVGQVYNVTFWLLNAGRPPNSFMIIMSV